MKRRIAIIVIFAAAVVFLLGFQSFEAQEKKEDDYYKYIETMIDVLREIKVNYVEEVDDEELFLGALKGMTGELDPHSGIIPPEALSIFTEDNVGKFGGLGIEITLRDGILTIVVPIPGTPAERAGLLPDDKILEIDGESTEGINLIDAVNKLRGKVGTEVTIQVLHTGAPETVEVTIVREEIMLHSVVGYEKNADGSWMYVVDEENKIGYIRLKNFAANTVEEFDEVCKNLVDEGMKGLVLDLRFNAGGLLAAAIGISDLFISEGAIVSTEGRNSPRNVTTAHKSGTYPYFPLVVLVNDSSASASEIVAGAIQDNKRGLIVGEETYGKGSVQDVIKLKFGDKECALKLTKARYFTPSGRGIHRDPKTKKGGITPDISVPFTREEKVLLYRMMSLHSTEKVIESMKEKNDIDIDKEEPQKEEEKELSPFEKELEEKQKTFTDRQMQRGLDYIHDVLLNEKMEKAQVSLSAAHKPIE